MKKILLFLKLSKLLKSINMKNWKTTLAGIMGAIGLYLTNSSDPTSHLIGTLLVGGGSLLMGFAAKDSNVTGGTTAQTPEAEKRV